MEIVRRQAKAKINRLITCKSRPQGLHSSRTLHELFVPTAIMEKVSRRLELFPDSSLRDLRALGKADYVDSAIAELTSLGHIEVTRGGPGKPTKHRLLKRYREHEDEEN